MHIKNYTENSQSIQLIFNKLDLIKQDDKVEANKAIYEAIEKKLYELLNDNCPEEIFQKKILQVLNNMLEIDLLKDCYQAHENDIKDMFKEIRKIIKNNLTWEQVYFIEENNRKLLTSIPEDNKNSFVRKHINKLKSQFYEIACELANEKIAEIRKIWNSKYKKIYQNFEEEMQKYNEEVKKAETAIEAFSLRMQFLSKDSKEYKKLEKFIKSIQENLIKPELPKELPTWTVEFLALCEATKNGIAHIKTETINNFFEHVERMNQAQMNPQAVNNNNNNDVQVIQPSAPPVPQSIVKQIELNIEQDSEESNTSLYEKLKKLTTKEELKKILDQAEQQDLTCEMTSKLLCVPAQVVSNNVAHIFTRDFYLRLIETSNQKKVPAIHPKTRQVFSLADVKESKEIYVKVNKFLKGKIAELERRHEAQRNMQEEQEAIEPEQILANMLKPYKNPDEQIQSSSVKEQENNSNNQELIKEEEKPIENAVEEQKKMSELIRTSQDSIINSAHSNKKAAEDHEEPELKLAAPQVQPQQKKKALVPA